MTEAVPESPTRRREPDDDEPRRADPSRSAPASSRSTRVLARCEGLDDRPVERARRGVRAAPTSSCAAPSTPDRDAAERRAAALSDPCRPPAPAGRRAGPPRAGPLARARQRADRRRPGEGVRRGRHQAGHRRHHRRRDRGRASDPDRPDYVSRGGHKLAGALAAFEPAGPGGRRPALPGRGRVDRRLHRRAAAARAPREVVAVDVGYGQLAWSLRQRRPGARCTTAPTSASSTPELIGGPVDLVVGDLSFISLALVLARCSRVHRARRRPGADGQAAVRGRQGPGRQGRGGARPGAARRGGAPRSPTARRRPRLGRPGGDRQPAARARRATWSSSCGCGAGRAAVGADDIHRRGASAAASLGVPGEKVDP